MLGAWWPGQLNFVSWCVIFSAHFFLAWKRVSIHMDWTRQPLITLRFTGHFRVVGPQYRTFLMSFVCYIEFGWGCKIFGKLVDPCTYYLVWMYVAGKVLLYQISHEMYFVYIWCAEIVSDIDLFFHTNKFLPSNQCPHQSSLLGTSCS